MLISARNVCLNVVYFLLAIGPMSRITECCINVARSLAMLRSRIYILHLGNGLKQHQMV